MEIPKLTGFSYWVNFRDKFSMELKLTIGRRGFSLDYKINPNERTVTRSNSTLVEVEMIDTFDMEKHRVGATHFGIAFKKDNSQV